MITYEEALAKARKCIPDINSCDEFEQGWHFYYDDGVLRDGGISVVVTKDKGECLGFMRFLEYIDFKLDEPIRTIKVK